MRQRTSGPRHLSSHREGAKETAVLEAYVQWNATGLRWDTRCQGSSLPNNGNDTPGRAQLW